MVERSSERRLLISSLKLYLVPWRLEEFDRKLDSWRLLVILSTATVREGRLRYWVFLGHHWILARAILTYIFRKALLIENSF
jgi:hypothetical protein